MIYEKRNLINYEFKINFVKIKMSKEKRRKKKRSLGIRKIRGESPTNTNKQ